MEVGRVRAIAHRRHLGQNHGEDAGVEEQIERPARVRTAHHADKFFAEAFGGNQLQIRRVAAQGVPGAGFDFEREAGGKPHRPQHAQGVFGETVIGRADAPNPPAPQVREAANIVNHPPVERIEEEGVHCEIAPQGVFSGSAGFDTVRAAMIRIRPLAAERGDFANGGGAALAAFLPLAFRDRHQTHAELCPDKTRFAKQRGHIRRGGARGNVHILGGQVQKTVSHRPAHPIRFVPGGAQTAHNRQRGPLGGGMGGKIGNRKRFYHEKYEKNEINKDKRAVSP